MISSFPLQQQTQFDRHTFRGDLPEGWEVELYQNRALIGFQQSRPDGLYEFNNVPLVFGLNEFRLVFYGPQGQRREETARFNIAESLTPAGRALLPRRRQRPARLDAPRPARPRLRHFAPLHRVARPLLGRARSRRPPRLRAPRPARILRRALRGRGTGGRSRRRGSRRAAPLQTRLGPLGITARYTGLADGFTSETFRPIYGEIRSRTSLRLDATIPAGRSSGIPAVIDFTEDRLASGQSVDHLTGRLSGFYRGFAVSHLLDWTFSRGGDRRAPRRLRDRRPPRQQVREELRSPGRAHLLGQARSEISSASLTAERVFPGVLRAGRSPAERRARADALSRRDSVGRAPSDSASTSTMRGRVDSRPRSR